MAPRASRLAGGYRGGGLCILRRFTLKIREKRGAHM